MTPTPDVTGIIARGRRVLAAHPSITLDAAGLLHTLDALEHDDRTDARAYLLHVYGLTVGITTPAAVALEPWPSIPTTLAAHLEQHSPEVKTANDKEPCRQLERAGYCNTHNAPWPGSATRCDGWSLHG